jgi:2-polyprenyl-3-methyl-5-hydroxy-6-metoxy-1,4-benzoquinol methylase
VFKCGGCGQRFTMKMNDSCSAEICCSTALVERAGPGIHASVFEFFSSNVQKSARVLDCGAGTGAFLQRLWANGYRDLRAIEIDAPAYGGPVPLIRTDLNKPFAHLFAERFDVILAVEVLEHLESPANFLRESGACLGA